MTQPSVSSAIGALGRELECDLFKRAGRGIQLTEAGRAFAPYAEDVVGLLQSGRQAAREAALLSARRLQIAAVTTAAESFVPGLMRAFSERHPEIELTLVVGNHQDVYGRVLNHSADVAVSGRPPGDERLLAQPLMTNEIVCITAPEDPVAGGPRVKAAALSERSWLLREPGSGTRTLNEGFLVDRGIRPRVLTLGSNGAIKQAARAGLGISLLSRAAVQIELESGRLGEIALEDGPPARPWFVVRSDVGPVRPAVELFTSFLRLQATGVTD